MGAPHYFGRPIRGDTSAAEAMLKKEGRLAKKGKGECETCSVVFPTPLLKGHGLGKAVRVEHIRSSPRVLKALVLSTSLKVTVLSSHWFQFDSQPSQFTPPTAG